MGTLGRKSDTRSMVVVYVAAASLLVIAPSVLSFLAPALSLLFRFGTKKICSESFFTFGCRECFLR